MEELSIEEKAKRYDEVLERAKYYQKENGSAVISAIFPELKEDERIKSCIKTCLSNAGEQVFDNYNIRLSDCLAWLKKQKETTIPDKANSNKNTSAKNEKKYILTDETIEYCGHRLYRIKAIRSFSGVRKGSLGGWVESEDNLSQEDDCWIFDEAKVFRKAKVSENAKVKDNACIYGNACVSGNVKISGNAEVYGNVCIYDYVSISEYAKIFGSISINGYACIRGDAVIKSTNDYTVFENIYSTSRYFTWTRSNNMWAVGCFYGTSKELIKKGYKDSELTGKCYEAIVKAQEEILKITNKKL